MKKREAPDIIRKKPCIFCSKRLGNWTNVGRCIENGPEKLCGSRSGTQRQIRKCLNGTSDKCETNERGREIPCQFRPCPGNKKSSCLFRSGQVT